MTLTSSGKLSKKAGVLGGRRNILKDLVVTEDVLRPSGS